MPFNRKEVESLLVACRRRCCICYRWCGTKIETDHIIPESKGGSDEIENAIPVCFECHAEIHSYADDHPRGRKFLPNELRLHKEHWLKLCAEHPEHFVNAPRDIDVGPLQALIDELCFNEKVADYPGHDKHGCLFHDDQFRRAIKEGSIAPLKSELRNLILEAYVASGRANQQILSAMAQAPPGNSWAECGNRAMNGIKQARQAISEALEGLSGFLRSES